jgi:serine/threonine protein kinase
VEKIGKYEIIEKIGSGGMGVVYKALDPLLERMVAIKTIHTHLDAEPELRARFFQEGRSAAQLSHKNIITIYDLGEDNGVAYMAMEYLDGLDLKTRIAQGDIQSLPQKLGIMMEISEGLAHAHARQVIHRDIKPANIFLTRSDQVKILDFGLARIASGNVTRTGIAVGTPNYMSPEQVCGERADLRTDIFSAGALFYEILTMRRAFDADSVTATIARILHSEPSLDEINSIDPELAFLVKRTLAKDREARYQTADELLADVRKLAGKFRPAEAGPVEKRSLSVTKAGISNIKISEAATVETPAGSRYAPSTAPLTTKPAGEKWGGFRTIYYSAGAFLFVAGAGVWFWTAHLKQGVGGNPARSQPPISAAVPQSAIPAPFRFPTQPSGISQGGFPATKVVLPADGAHAQEMLESQHPQEGRPKLTPQEIRPGGPSVREGKTDTNGAGNNEATKAGPGNPDRRQSAAEGNAYARKSAADAMDQMLSARKKADAAGAEEFARQSLEAARRAELEASALYDAQNFPEAAARLFDASGLYLKASAEAEGEKQMRESRARLSQQQKAFDAGQADLARKSFEQERLDATKVESSTRAPQTFVEALRLASDAQSEWNQEDFAKARSDFEKAAQVMQRAKTEAIEATRKAERARADAVAPKPESLRPVPPSPEENKQAIAAALLRYADSLQARDIQMLKSVFPTLPVQQEEAIRQEFRIARQIEVRLSGIDTKVNGDSATAIAQRKYVMVTTDGHRLQTDTRTVISLHRSGSSWLIEGIRYENAR